VKCRSCRLEAYKGGLCHRHYLAALMRKERLLEKRKTDGLCRWCTKPATQGPHCAEHQARQREYQRRCRERRR